MYDFVHLDNLLMLNDKLLLSMSVKYFCDICEIEISLKEKVHIIGWSETKINTICKSCWDNIEVNLLRAKDLSSFEEEV